MELGVKWAQKKRRSQAITLTFLLVAALSAVPALSAPTGPRHVGDLGLDQAVFWDGGYVGNSVTHSLPLVPSANVDRCQVVDPCFIYTLGVVDSGAGVLRIAIDTPMRDDAFEVTIISPSGAMSKRSNSNQYSTEALISQPSVGTWTIKVAPVSAEYASFRMRAKLEATPYVPQATGTDLLPNLRVSRIWEFGFAAPANPGNGLFPPDDTNPPLEVAGQRPVSCSADEVLDDGVKRCLRYSFGLANLGPGNFDIRFNGDRSGATYQMTQCVQQVSGPPRSRPAGQGIFHATHGHFHYHDIIFHELLKVTDRTTGEMVAAGDGKKLGYSPADQGITEWNLFNQAPSGTSGAAGNCAPGTNTRLGMSRGWGDAYRYQRPGNYVEFGDNGDGWYVVRTIADPEGVVQELDETDNTSYAYIRVVGEDVQLIESGKGLSPWDPNKIIYEQ